MPMYETCFFDGFTLNLWPDSLLHNCVVNQVTKGVYKQWTGLLEWWNSGMVDWRVFVLVFIICHVVSTL